MNLNDLLLKKGINPSQVLVFRHRPCEPELHKVLPWLATERPDTYNAYQQTQHAKLEKVMETMKGTGYVASFIGHEPKQALFVGLYSIKSSLPLTYEEYWHIPFHNDMKKFGNKGWEKEEDRTSVLWFELILIDFYNQWKGKLIVSWPTPERVWWRRADRNEMPVYSILQESMLEVNMPRWDAIELKWEELAVLPAPWKSALSQWRGIYYIYDLSDGKGYVGSAYGENNLFGRWQNYAALGDGGNKLLRKRDSNNFRFTILQRVSPDMEARDVIQLETSWKQRLHTYHPYGLNSN